MSTTAPRRRPRKATPKSLENAALAYLARYSASVASLRRVLARRVRRSAEVHGTDPDEAAAWIDDIVTRLARQGMLDDGAYAETKALAMHRRGVPGHVIVRRLAAKGVAADLAEAALASLDGGQGSPDFDAAVNLARRRRLGPFRPAGQRAERRDKDLAALARAGFSFDLARRIVDAEDVETLEDPAFLL